MGVDPKDIECMKMAIEAARHCRPEKPDAPKVGAVARFPDGTTVAAFRGEYVPAFNGEQGPGDHAEYTLLEKKLPDATLAGSTIYATLEPCSTARTPPKIPCAIRLQGRCVEKVWIGMLDPDKRIQGDGQQLLAAAGIETQLFPLSLSKEVTELNREFIMSRRDRVRPESASVRKVNIKLEPHETLHTPSISIAEGTSIVGGGTGLFSQPSSINFDVPSGASVRQVLLYWNGVSNAAREQTIPIPETTEDHLTINGITVAGTLIGGPTLFFADNVISTYRADITELGLLAAGSNNLIISGGNFDHNTNGASMVAIIDGGTTPASIGLVDGQDLAFINFAPPLKDTVPQTISFTASAVDRLAKLTLIAGGVQGQTPGSDPGRPNQVTLTFDGTPPATVNCGAPGTAVCLVDPFASRNGNEWDHFVASILIPGGSTSVTIQAFSASDGSGRLPASFAWIAAALSVPPPCLNR